MVICGEKQAAFSRGNSVHFIVREQRCLLSQNLWQANQSSTLALLKRGRLAHKRALLKDIRSR
jgi:hypothetical protein